MLESFTHSIRKYPRTLSPIIPILSRINPIPRIDTYFFKIRSDIVLSSTPSPSKRYLSCRFSVKILKALLPSSILATWSAHLKFLDLIILTILVERQNYEAPHCGAFSTPHSHHSWAQIFTSGSCFQIPFACIPPSMKRPYFPTLCHNCQDCFVYPYGHYKN